MATTGKIMNFYSDKEMTTAAFPRTKVDAVSDNTGTGLGAILDGKLSKVLTSDCYGDELPETGVEGQVFFKPAGNESIESSILQAIYPVNSIYTYGSNVSPAEILGFGEWELVGKGYIDLAVGHNFGEAGCLFTPNENCTSGMINVVRGGQSIRIRIDITLAAAITDNSTSYGTIDFETLGISSIFMGYYGTYAANDSANGAVQMQITTSGEVKSVDYLLRTDDQVFEAGDALQFMAILSMDKDHMLDSACDKFYWKRTA